jgi:hypothetical protein
VQIVAAFQQAGVKLERENEFEELRGAIRRAADPGKIEKLLLKGTNEVRQPYGEREI